jgi:hypothetical protein
MRRDLVVPAFVAFLAIGWFIYRVIIPGEGAYRSELARSANIALPESAQFIAGCSNFYDTVAVFELRPSDLKRIRRRFESVGRAGAMFKDVECEPSVRPALGTPIDTMATVIVGVDQLRWGINAAQNRLYWQVSVD